MKKNILIVDDIKDEMDYFTNVFKLIPGVFNYIYAGGPEKAMSILKRMDIDLLFAQYRLPKNGALLLVSAIRSYRRYKNLKVYLYSDHVTQDESKMAQRLGASGCLEKINDHATRIRQLKAMLNSELLPGYVFFRNNEVTRFLIVEEESGVDQKKQQMGDITEKAGEKALLPAAIRNPGWQTGNDQRILVPV